MKLRNLLLIPYSLATLVALLAVLWGRTAGPPALPAHEPETVVLALEVSQYSLALRGPTTEAIQSVLARSAVPVRVVVYAFRNELRAGGRAWRMGEIEPGASIGSALDEMLGREDLTIPGLWQQPYRRALLEIARDPRRAGARVLLLTTWHDGGDAPGAEDVHEVIGRCGLHVHAIELGLRGSPSPKLKADMKACGVEELAYAYVPVQGERAAAVELLENAIEAGLETPRGTTP